MVNEFILNQLPNELFQLLANVGYVGINKGFFAESQSIFESIVAACPENIFAQQALGIAYIFSRKITEGTKVLFNVLKKDPKNELCRSFLAIAFKMTKVDNEAIGASRSVVEHGKDPAAIQIAKAILDSYETLITPKELQAEQATKVSSVQ